MRRDISKKTVLDKLPRRTEPYWRSVGVVPRLYIGYRQGATGGAWIARYQDDDGKKHYRAIGKRPPMEYGEAVQKAIEWGGGAEKGVTKVGTVAEAVEAYIANKRLRSGEKPAQEATQRLTRTVLEDPLGKVSLDRLRPKNITDWLARHSEEKSANSVNRDFSALRACLNHAYHQQQVASNTAWTVVKPLPGVKAEQADYLEREQWKHLLAHCDNHLGAIVKGLLFTGARPIELRRALVKDFNSKLGVLTLQSYKGKGSGSRSRVISLPDAGVAFFRRQIRSKLPQAYLFTRADGSPWPKEFLNSEFRKARAAAGFGPGCTPYSARRSLITEWLKKRIPVTDVAKMAGTSVQMIERSYYEYIPARTKNQIESASLL